MEDGIGFENSMAKDCESFGADVSEMLSALSNDAIMPGGLARLFSFTFGASEKASVLRNVLQRNLLSRTINHAIVNTKYYSKNAYEIDIDRSNVCAPDLSTLPVLTRKDVIERQDDFIASDVQFGQVCHTSGSTGASLNIYKSSSEIDFIFRYYSELLQPATKRLASLPLTLSFPTAYHGVPMRVPAIGKVFVSGVTDNTLIKDACEVLSRRYRIPGHDETISAISGMLFQVHFFTSYLLENGIDPKQFGLKSLIVFGGYASELTRRFLSQTWDATVYDRYSLTESVGGANRHFERNCFCLDPHVIGEVVDVDSNSPITAGVGKLLLTQLYPFVQMQPLLRYDTGDIVRKLEDVTGTNLAFEFLGKRGNCIGRKNGEKTEWLILSVHYFELLNAIPDVNAVEWFANVTTARDRTVGSKPIQRVSTESVGERLIIKLEIELRYAPHCYPHRIQELKAYITNGLIAKSEALRCGIEFASVQLDIDFFSPGSLNGASTIKV